MRRASALWEVFVLRFEEALGRYRKRRLTAEEAGELLGMSGRNFRRLIVRYDEEGEAGLRDRRLGRPSPRRAPAAELSRMQSLYQERYRDFTVKHFHEQLQQRHNYKLGYTVTRLALQGAGLVAKAKRRGTHRKRRERRPLPGMLLFQDGSTHRWIAGLDHDLDLVVTLDDATGAIYSAILLAEEGTMSSFLGLCETIAEQGLFRAFYTDRGSHYFHTPKAGGKVDKSKPTQVGRALAQLGITHIPSYSPEARGRMERAFGTLQNRLPPELRLAGIATIEAANRYLKEQFVPDYNARFAVPAEEEGSAFIAYAGRPLEDILCLQESRQVGRDNCVTWNGLSLQVPPQRHRHH
jgi:transposase